MNNQIYNSTRDSIREATVRYALADVMNIQIKENPSYPISAFISDTGGAAGLFLGLDVIG